MQLIIYCTERIIKTVIYYLDLHLMNGYNFAGPSLRKCHHWHSHKGNMLCNM